MRGEAADLSRHWTLDPEVAFLNHGSFGACPRAVLDAQRGYRERMERQPVRFLTREAPALLAQAREALARFIGASPENLALVPNATSALNAVLRSLPLAAGDELLVTDHEYNASRNALDFVAERHGARVVVVAIPFPLESADTPLDALLQKVGPRTRLALLDHVTSATALVLPIGGWIRELEQRGVAVLIDGAHAPGMLELELEALAPSYYTGNCHKWLCAPKGAGFLWVRADRREQVRPAVISHGANAPVPRSELFRAEFDWMGTADPSAALAVPDAIACIGGLLAGGWTAVRERNRALAVEGRRILCEALGVEPACPEAMLGSMAAVELPASRRFPIAAHATRGPVLGRDPLHDRLLDEHRIEVPVLLDPARKSR
ncbi:MAG TPA: aminotransferase class V-fold PLP-dependent enzyme, partial [Myxococcota bacterium]|nr:aminotransferase class V-fold PLP-dependent enzyme [Myxococcota bacterium]